MILDTVEEVPTRISSEGNLVVPCEIRKCLFLRFAIL